MQYSGCTIVDLVFRSIGNKLKIKIGCTIEGLVFGNIGDASSRKEVKSL